MATEPYDHGRFCWTDLATSDAKAAKRFYGPLFGWSFEDIPMGEGDSYTMARLDGADVGGLYRMLAEQLSAGVPPHWSAVVAVDSCDATVDQVPALGGRVLQPPFDLAAGRMAVIADPQGAALSLWQRDSLHAGAARLGYVHGTLCWTELDTTDTAAAAAFYGPLMGWATRSTPMPDGPYTEFLLGDTSVAGMMAIRPEWGDVLPNWLVYFTVADCAASAAQVSELGGAVLNGPFDVPGVGPMAVVRDPQGAVFAVIEMTADA
jgi:hypothetical protein